MSGDGGQRFSDIIRAGLCHLETQRTTDVGKQNPKDKRGVYVIDYQINSLTFLNMLYFSCHELDEKIDATLVSVR